VTKSAENTERGNQREFTGGGEALLPKIGGAALPIDLKQRNIYQKLTGKKPRLANF